jgi:hypothetical protein
MEMNNTSIYDRILIDHWTRILYHYKTPRIYAKAVKIQHSLCASSMQNNRQHDTSNSITIQALCSGQFREQKPKMWHLSR